MALEDVLKKECSSCHRLLPLSMFATRKNARGALVPRGVCRDCVNAKQREKRASHKNYSTANPKKICKEDSLGVARPAAVRFVASDEKQDVFSLFYGSGYAVQLECPYCGSRKKVRANALSRPNYELCPHCVVDEEGNLVERRKSRLLQDAVPDAVLWWDDKRDISTVYAKSKYQAAWKCPQCNHRFVRSVRNFSPRCNCSPVVGEGSLVVRAPQLTAEFSEKNSVNINSLSYNSAKRVLWECPKGHEWEASVYQRVNGGTGCPECACNGKSRAEEELCNYVIELLGEDAVIANDKSVISPHELDIYVPKRNIAIEYNGVYWHSERKGKGGKYHRNKVLTCKDAGVQLITVWEDEWQYRRDTVKSMIAHKLGVSPAKRVHARQTKVVELTVQQAREFCERYHIQGFVQGSLYAGLTNDNGDVVAVSVWRKNGIHAYLERYCTSQVVVGGMGKLLAYGLSWAQNKGISQIVTFADLCVSNGDLYEKLGFTQDKIIRPDYKYVVNDRRVHKFNYRKKRFKEDPNLVWQDGLSESELAILNGIDRVWDCGKIRYTLQV